MALIKINYLSQALCKITTVQVYIPNDLNPDERRKNPCYDRPMKVLYLLHGYSGNDTDWIQGTFVCSLAAKYNFAVVCPSGDNSFYFDQDMTGRKYSSFVGEELPSYMRKTFGFSRRREDTWIGGLSMGGLGAVCAALKYPQTFSKAIGLSSAFVINEILTNGKRVTSTETNQAFQDHIYGSLGALKDSEKNPEALLLGLLDSGNPLPGLYLACGTEDYLLENNREFRDFLIKQGVPFSYTESPGEHNWEFWNQALTPAVKWMIEE